jgi:hypothetical protein
MGATRQKLKQGANTKAPTGQTLPPAPPSPDFFILRVFEIKRSQTGGRKRNHSGQTRSRDQIGVISAVVQYGANKSHCCSGLSSSRQAGCERDKPGRYTPPRSHPGTPRVPPLRTAHTGHCQARRCACGVLNEDEEAAAAGAPAHPPGPRVGPQPAMPHAPCHSVHVRGVGA